MRFGIAVFIALATPAVLATPHQFQHAKFSQVAFVDLNELSKSFFHGRIRFSLTEEFLDLKDAQLVTDHETNDNGQETDATYMVLKGEPLVTYSLAIDEVDSLGRVLRNLGSQQSQLKDMTTSPADQVIVKPTMGLQGIQFADSAGKQIWTNFSFKMQPVIYADPKTHWYTQIADPAVELSLSFAWIPADSSISTKGTMFWAKEQAVPESMVKPAQCQKADEVVEISSLQFGVDITTSRMELCYSTGPSSFQRIVLLKDNPPHEPDSMIDRVNSAALNRGGTIAKSPLVKLDGMRVASANCHGYALAATGGLAGGPYWIEAKSDSTYTEGTHPFDVLLKANYLPIFSVTSDYYSTTNEENLATDSRLREGDFVTFFGPGGYAHSGVARKTPDGQMWLESKFEEGPVLSTPFTSIHDVIKNLYSEIQVYRRKLLTN